MDAKARGESLVRAVRALDGDSLRIGYLAEVIRTSPAAELAPVLDLVCFRAEQAEESAREVLIALVDTLARGDLGEAVQTLREQAAGEALLALDRLLRQPESTAAPRSARQSAAAPVEPRVPDYGRGRPLTLGERKSLARKSDRQSMERLLADPHPDVIRRLLVNPRMTEEYVLRLATKRPARADILLEVAKAPRWMHRPNVRRALVLNPDTPLAISTSVVGLLLRQELKSVAEATDVPPILRALCLEHLERRPPVDLPRHEDDPLQ